MCVCVSARACVCVQAYVYACAFINTCVYMNTCTCLCLLFEEEQDDASTLASIKQQPLPRASIRPIKKGGWWMGVGNTIRRATTRSPHLPQPACLRPSTRSKLCSKTQPAHVAGGHLTAHAHTSPVARSRSPPACAPTRARTRTGLASALGWRAPRSPRAHPTCSTQP